MKTIVKFFSEMFRSRSGKVNSKIFWGSVFAVSIIVGAFTGVDAEVLKIETFCMLTLFGYTLYDNKLATKKEQ